jgi:hypothetical protein
MAANEVTKLLDTIMSIPGMNETVKINLQISRKSVLLLSSVIENGLNKDGPDLPLLLENLSPESLEELRNFSQECLKKAGLVELKDKLKSFEKK